MHLSEMDRPAAELTAQDLGLEAEAEVVDGT